MVPNYGVFQYILIKTLQKDSLEKVTNWGKSIVDLCVGYGLTLTHIFELFV